MLIETNESTIETSTVIPVQSDIFAPFSPLLLVFILVWIVATVSDPANDVAFVQFNVLISVLTAGVGDT